MNIKIEIKYFYICRVGLTRVCSTMASAAGEDRTHSSLNLGTVVPNRIFVGGLTSKTNEEDLKVIFSGYGCIKATKIPLDKYGASKGYGFVTFETEEEAQKVLSVSESFTLKDRKLNVARAIKKHPYNRNLESAAIHATPVVWSANPYVTSPGFSSREPVYYPQASVPMIWQQQLYVPPPQASTPNVPPYFYAIAPDFQYQNLGNASDVSETSSNESGENGKNRSRTSPAPTTTDYERNRSSQMKTCHAPSVCIPKYNSWLENQSTYAHASPVPPMHHVLAKTVNGVAVMAYPTPFLMGSPTIVHMKDDSENMSDVSYMHSSIPTGALTPPPTPMGSMSCDFNVNTSMESSRKS